MAPRSPTVEGRFEHHGKMKGTNGICVYKRFQGINGCFSFALAGPSKLHVFPGRNPHGGMFIEDGGWDAPLPVCLALFDPFVFGEVLRVQAQLHFKDYGLIKIPLKARFRFVGYEDTCLPRFRQIAAVRVLEATSENCSSMLRAGDMVKNFQQLMFFKKDG